jgi:hypothetical protein
MHVDVRFAAAPCGHDPHAAMNFLRVISKRIRREESGVQIAGDVNAVLSANVGKRGSTSRVTSTQRSRVVQRSHRQEADETPAADNEDEDRNTH